MFISGRDKRLPLSIQIAAQYKNIGAMQIATNINERDGITMGLRGTLTHSKAAGHARTDGFACHIGGKARHRPWERTMPQPQKHTPSANALKRRFRGYVIW